MVRVAVVNHNVELVPGRLQPFLDRVEAVDVWAPGGVYPDGVDAAVVLGGFMGAYDTVTHGWLEAEKDWVRRLVTADKPVLGICLGAQLLADALGGLAFLAPQPEVGVIEVSLTPEGARHPLARLLGKRAFFAHQDTFRLPPGATLLATTDSYPAVFEVGSALAVQAHPETATDEAIAWADYPEFDLPARIGLSKRDYIEQLRDHRAEAEAAARRLFGAWFGGLG